MLTFALVHGVVRALWKRKDGVFALAAWNPLPGSGSCGVRKPNDTSAVGLGSCSDVSGSVIQICFSQTG